MEPNVNLSPDRLDTVQDLLMEQNRIIQMQTRVTRHSANPLNQPDLPLPTLPDEILFHIFSYLPRKKLLQVRQLNHYWNHFITASQRVQNSTVFRISALNEHYINQSLLINRMPLSIPWKKICLDETSFMIQIPLQKELRKIHSLYIKQITQFEWIYCQELLSQLRSLESLYIKIESNLCNVLENKIEDDPDIIQKFRGVIRNLKSLTLIAGSGDFVLFILRKFIPFAHGLEELRIEIGEEYKGKTVRLCKKLYKIIAGSAKSLKVLDIGLNDKRSAGHVFCTQVLSQLKVNQIQLNLQEFYLRNTEVRSDDEAVFFDFIKTQSNLVSAFIPTLNTPSGPTCLPKTLTNLFLWDGFGLEPEKLEYFPDLNELQITQDHLASGMEALTNKISSTSFPKLQTLSVNGCGFANNFVEDLGRLFPNLTKLVINTVGFSPEITYGNNTWLGIGDKEVQTIAKNLASLEFLSLKNCKMVTSAGWTGIRTEFLEGLSKDQLENLDFDIPEEEMDGVSLGSLKYLKVLDIQTTGQISHVALKYGFTFPEITKLSIVDFYGTGLSGFDLKSVTLVCTQLPTLEHLRMRLIKQIHWDERVNLVKLLPNMVDTTQNFSLFTYHFSTPCQSYRNWMANY